MLPETLSSRGITHIKDEELGSVDGVRKTTTRSNALAGEIHFGRPHPTVSQRRNHIRCMLGPASISPAALKPPCENAPCSSQNYQVLHQQQILL